VQSPQNSDYAIAWNKAASPPFSMGSHSREDHIERSVTRNVIGEQRKEKFLDDRNGRPHKGTSLDKRVNSQKNAGRKNRDTKVTQKRIQGAGIAPTNIRRSLRGERTVPQGPGMWENIENGGLKDPPNM
jgi:hypothetical protein